MMNDELGGLRSWCLRVRKGKLTRRRRGHGEGGEWPVCVRLRTSDGAAIEGLAATLDCGR